MDIKVNTKALNGGARPDRHTLTINEMIVDPENTDLEELSNPIDYFNIYKQKMKELARQRFDRDKDLQFFNYLDRLVEPEKFLNEDGSRLNGLALLSQFVTDK